MNNTIIEVQGLVTHYGETRVLDQVSCEIKKGEIFVIIGGSGCGKTTLIKHMTGLLQPTSGRILFLGNDITKMDEDELAKMQRSIGIAFQSSGLFNSMTVGDNIALPLREYGNMDEKLIDLIVRLKLSLVGLAAAQNLMPDELSGGMRKRAGLARAIGPSSPSRPPSFPILAWPPRFPCRYGPRAPGSSRRASRTSSWTTRASPTTACRKPATGPSSTSACCASRPGRRSAPGACASG